MSKQYRAVCCDYYFIGMNHSPELEGKCRHCGVEWPGERQIMHRYTKETEEIVHKSTTGSHQEEEK